MHEFHQSLAARGNSPRTIAVRLNHLHNVKKHLPDLLVASPDDLELFWVAARKKWKPAYLKSVRTSITMFYSWAIHHQLVSVSPAASIAPVRVPRAMPRPVPERRVLEAFQVGTLAERAIIALAQTQGLRREEIATVHPENRIDQSLRVLGKGNKERIVPLDFLTYSLLREIEKEQGDDDFYFPGRFGGHLHPATVYKWVKALLPDYSLHQLRHTAGSHGLHKTHDVRAVQELLGHESLDTTMIYTFVNDDSIRAVVEANSLARFFPPTIKLPAPTVTAGIEPAALASALLLVQQWVTAQAADVSHGQ